MPFFVRLNGEVNVRMINAPYFKPLRSSLYVDADSKARKGPRIKNNMESLYFQKKKIFRIMIYIL